MKETKNRQRFRVQFVKKQKHETGRIQLRNNILMFKSVDLSLIYGLASTKTLRTTNMDIKLYILLGFSGVYLSSVN